MQDATDQIEEDNKSYMEKISNMGDQMVEREKYEKMKEKYRDTERELMRAKNSLLAEKSEAEALKKKLGEAREKQEKQGKVHSQEYEELLTKYRNLQRQKRQESGNEFATISSYQKRRANTMIENKSLVLEEETLE